MRVRIITFEAMAAQLSRAELALDLPKGATVGEALDALAAAHEPVRAMGDRLATAVNMAYVRRDHRLSDGDELALIPPVSGG